MSETFEDIVVDVSKMETTTPTRENSSQVGNAAAMREALKKVRRVLHCAIVADILKGDDVNSAFNEVTAALSAPPRNCDAFSKSKVLEMLEDRSFSKEDTIEWLFDEAKGE